MGVVARILAPLIGRPTRLSDAVLGRYPELNRAHWRRGGLPPRIGGWCLGKPSVSAITFWHTIWIAPHVEPNAELLLHELRHVDQFEADRTFPLRYLWQSLRYGYFNNRFEQDARAFAASRVRDSHPERMA